MAREQLRIRVTKKQFLRSRLWRDGIRPQILKRDLYTCEDCGGRAEEVHHEKPLPDMIITKEDWDIATNPNNLKSKCKSCHSKITSGNMGDVADGYRFDENGQVVRL